MPTFKDFLPADRSKSQLIFQTVVATGLMATIDFFFATASAAYIFSGELSKYMPVGLGALLICSVIPSLFISFWGSNAATICAARGSLTPIVAALAAGIAATLTAANNEQQLVPTLVAGIGAGTIVTGIVLYLLGRFKLGNLIRYIPYPVMGGFFAGLGYALLTGGIGLMANAPVELLNPGPLFASPALLFCWGPGLIFGLALYFTERWKSHWLLVPGFFFFAGVIFYLLLLVFGVDLTRAGEMGLLIVVEGDVRFWPALGPSDLGQINVAAIAGEYDILAAIALIGAISLLLDASGIEILTKKDLSLDQDLKTTGIANVFTGLAGGCVGVHVVSDVGFTFNLGAKTRLASLTFALLSLLSIFIGPLVLGFVPVPVLGGLLVYLGASFLIKWLYDEYKRLPTIDYAIVLIILVAMVILGVLQGVGVGLVLAIMIFTYNYSKVDVVKFSIPGSQFDTYVDRPRAHTEILETEGDRIHVYILKGYLFFGTANKLLETINARVRNREQARLEYLVLDFRLVSQIDSSVAFSFGKLKLLAEDQGFQIVMTQISPRIQSQLDAIGFFGGEDAQRVRFFPELSQGGAWCQERLLSALDAPRLVRRSLDDLLQSSMRKELDCEGLSGYFETLELPKGHVLFRQGEAGDTMYLIGAGRVAVSAEIVPGATKHLRTLSAESIIGESALFLSGERSATATMKEDGVLYEMSHPNWERLSVERPELAICFHSFISRLLAHRLTQTNTRLLRILS